MNNEFLRFIFLNIGKAAGVILGLIVALFLVFLGILKTLLILAFIVLGYLIGKWYDEGVSVKKFFQDLLDSLSENKWQ